MTPSFVSYVNKQLKEMNKVKAGKGHMKERQRIYALIGMATVQWLFTGGNK